MCPLHSLKAESGNSNSIETENSENSFPQQSRSSSSYFTPGDGVMISVFPDTASFLNNIFPIDDRGYVELPIYGKIRLTDMTKVEFENFLKDKYRDYLRFPYVRVKTMIRVSVLGGVPTPGFYYYDPEYSLWELIHRAGGTTDEDGLKKMKWQRDRDDVNDNLIPYLQSGISLQNMGFRSGDQIWVRTPAKPSAFQQITRTVFPFITFALSMFTFYYTYQILITDRESGRRR
jgi:protein involved in polysaccharide export with SLBB domain